MPVELKPDLVLFFAIQKQEIAECLNSRELRLQSGFSFLNEIPFQGNLAVMEKRSSHYPLARILEQMTTVEEMNLTFSAQDGIRAAGMSKADAL